MTELRRYTFKLYPSRAQDATLAEQARMMAALWNAFLERWETKYARDRGGYGNGADRPRSCKRWTGYELKDLYASDSAWRALSTWSGRRVGDAFERACDAFYRRAKQGAGKSSGYPRYRSVARAEWIPGRLGQSVGIPCGGGSGWYLRPATGDPDEARKWRLRIKGMPGEIRARGELPVCPTKWADADIRWRNGAWWLSIAVEMPARRAAGARNVQVRFDLIDEFAQVAMGPRRSRPYDGPKAVPAGGGSAIQPCGDGGRYNTRGGKGGLDGPGAGNGGIDTPTTPSGNGGVSLTLPDWADIYALQERIDALKAERDTRWPRKPGQRPSRRWREATRRIGRLSARLARKRREMLHEWTTAIVRDAGSLVVVKPETLKDATKSGHGNEKSWGGAVETKATFNRHVLSQAPASAVQMLAYKAAEAGIDYREAASDDLRVGTLAVRNSKELRRTRRIIRKDRAA